MVIDGIRDLVYDINSPSEATCVISKLMQWTDEYQIHLHTILHQNKSDENARGHIGTEINNKFIHSTNKEYHVAYSTYGNGVKDSVLYNSKKTYYVVTDTYTSDYHHLTVIDSLGDDVFAWNLLCDYLRQGKTF